MLSGKCQIHQIPWEPLQYLPSCWQYQQCCVKSEPQNPDWANQSFTKHNPTIGVARQHVFHQKKTKNTQWPECYFSQKTIYCFHKDTIIQRFYFHLKSLILKNIYPGNAKRLLSKAAVALLDLITFTILSQEQVVFWVLTQKIYKIDFNLSICLSIFYHFSFYVVATRYVVNNTRLPENFETT